MINEETQQAIMKEFDRGHRVAQLLISPGYSDLIQVMEAEVVKAEFRLMNAPAGSSSMLLRDLRSEARAKRSFFEQTQLRLKAITDVAYELANASTRPESEY
jgi:hypothetical protein